MPGFSRSEQARLALLARAQRGALAKLPEFALDAALPDNDRLLVWVLRQAAILCRSRAEPRLPEVKSEASNKRYRLSLPAGWLENRPLTQRALEEEALHPTVVLESAFNGRPECDHRDRCDRISG